MHSILPWAESFRCKPSFNNIPFLNAEMRTWKSYHMSAICICTCQQLCFGINSFEIRINSTCWKISQGIAQRPKQNVKSDSLKNQAQFCFSLNILFCHSPRERVWQPGFGGTETGKMLHPQVKNSSTWNKCLRYNVTRNHSLTSRRLQLRTKQF